MSYALDVNNLRVKAALEKLGIDKEELLIKTLNDFGNKATREEIKKLRFDYYSRRLEETVRVIKDTIKFSTSRTRTDNFKNFTACTDEGSSIHTLLEKSSNNRKIFINDKNKETLITALEEIKETVTTVDKKERPKSMAQPRNTKPSRFEHYRKNQQENINRIREREEINARKALSQSLRFSRKIRTPTKGKYQKLFNSRLKKPLSLSSSEVEIKEKLNKYEEKLEKSRVLHEKQILMKRESARSQPSAIKMETAKSDELIFKIIERTRGVSERKEKKIEELKEKWEKVKNFKEAKANRLKELEKEYKQIIHEKEEILERKLNAAEKVVKNRKASIGKDIELKIEVQKLKDEDANIKIKRAQKMMKHKHEIIIDRQKEENIKFEAKKHSRELSNSRKRDQAIQEMIEKERVNEVLRIIKKTPKSRVAVDLLKEFGMMPEKAETSVD
ncbi:hypothetical protein SteCoe_3060 [Stentor coeruleus]|uniref:Uncharacterized protein n=1 Tax=Stentor coeruleus TaxID=5963 RepID=A0A1R2CY35_9CILI|nr:hypothetical protein SteCoe_3060 [Stentor coeruleus]